MLFFLVNARNGQYSNIATDIQMDKIAPEPQPDNTDYFREYRINLPVFPFRLVHPSFLSLTLIPFFYAFPFFMILFRAIPSFVRQRLFDFREDYDVRKYIEYKIHYVQYIIFQNFP
jgi:hypothetical protein